MKIATYHRVSTTDQNPDGARALLREAAQKLGGEITLEIEETGSGAQNDRPGLQKLLGAVTKRKLDAVLVYKLDRFGRSALDVLANIQRLEASGVRFIAISQGIDIKAGGDAMGRLLLTMLAAVAEFERDLIVERTRVGLARARAAGKRLGRPSTVGTDRAIIGALRASGITWPEIAERLGCSIWAARRAGKGTTEGLT